MYARTNYTLGGMRVYADPNMVETVEDWSQVRSPSRAARRRRSGHVQRIRYVTRPMSRLYQLGLSLVGHPETITALIAAADKQSAPCPSERLDP